LTANLIATKSQPTASGALGELEAENKFLELREAWRGDRLILTADLMPKTPPEPRCGKTPV
jgi:hypothetical protein